MDDEFEPQNFADDDLEVEPQPVLIRATTNPLRRKTMGGAMLAAAMVGLQEALEGPKDEAVTMEIGSGVPPDDGPVAVDLDPEKPGMSVAVVRPWLQKDE